MKKTWLVCIVFITVNLFSQDRKDIRGAYFHYKWLYSSTYSISVTLITDASKNISRPTVRTDFGLGTAPTASAMPLNTTNNVNGINVSTYSGTHAYFPNNLYNLTYLDSFVISGIKNYPSSESPLIFAYAQVDCDGPPTPETSPEVPNLPLSLLNFTVSGNQILYNPFCQDADGDSLSYDLSAPWSMSGMLSGATINPVTGLFTFSKDSLESALYAFTIGIYEWRNLGGGGGKSQIGFTTLNFVAGVNTTGVGINELEIGNSDSGFKIFPNPATETINFKTEVINKKVKLEISNTLGENVLRKSEFDLTQSIDVSLFQQGIYTIKISSDAKTFNNKFVKVKN